MFQKLFDRQLSGRVWIPVVSALVVASAVLLGVVVFRPSKSNADASAIVGTTDSLRQPVRWHADFAVFVNGERFDFDKPEFISKEGEEHNPWVHIHEPRPTVVHVHREQTTWDEFMRSLGFELTDSKLSLPDGRVFETGGEASLKFYVNGVRVDTIMFESISDLSQVLISFGPESDSEVRETQIPMVTDQACIPSELCLDRVPAVPEPEPCTKSSGSCTG